MARDRSYPKNLQQTKKDKITQEEIDSIRQDARDAKELLENSYLLTYFNNSKQSILELHAGQFIEDVVVTTESNGVKKSLSTPAKKEYIMLAGQYRFIQNFLGDLEQTVLICQQMEEKIKSEELEVQEVDSE
jgi:hypothetical protein